MAESMIDITTIVMTLTVFLTEAFKRYLMNKQIPEEEAKFWSPFCAILIGMLLNLSTILLLEVKDYQTFWTTFQWQQILKDGLEIGMKAGGLYGMGKVVVNRTWKKDLTPP
ncbi:hypothetical protein Dred_1369 [Desulforamulus reducens MI-1]|uniref:Uncharacterized protein n=1 Tax=Desulforamulus reducens (strain ATCC BAA-1160 / DSM 100696 / MI-1) TaxID=349161 RepID=A4J497_DESRM|nr:hypothetical protein [Desulforamulus reducens]ABO49900.1 hypothetical protein Dred_1369 [Desulforamulus reducens MI-1]